VRAYAIADAFTTTPLEGNPVAVFLDAAGLSTERMQQIAREMNLSETTFVFPAENGGDARIRIFTPVNELPFAGHPLLGTAFVLGESTTADRIVVETAMGPVPVEFDREDGRIVVGRMRQPIPGWEPYHRTDHLLAALGVSDPCLPVEAYRNGPRHVLVALGSEQELERVTPEIRALAELPDMAAICFAGSASSWTMRMFAPAYGVVEDAATGSAAGPVAIHLARYGVVEWGRPLTIRQGAQVGRPSTLHVRVAGAAEGVDAVEVGGAAVVVGRGTLDV
jgi:trans-2,3-dihydro-3-hydroxyanthranilate isomerase